MSRKLTQIEIAKCNKLLNTIWKNVYKYCDPKDGNDEKNACIRLKNTSNKKYKKIKNTITY